MIPNGTIDFIYGVDGIMGISYKNAVYLFRKNVFGDVTHIYDTEGHLKARYIYDVWGNHKVVDVDEDDPIGEINPIRYRSYYYDDEIGLYYLRARYYDPETGRFISQDNINYLDPEHLSGLNLYAYCNDNPVMNADPTGCFALTTFLICLAVGTVVGAAMGGLFYSILTPSDEFKWEEFGVSVLTGAITGAITGFAAGMAGALSLGAVATTIVSSIAGGIAGGMGSILQDKLNHREINWCKFATSTVTGFGLGAIGGAMTHNLSVNWSWLDELTQGTLIELSNNFLTFSTECIGSYVRSFKK